MRKLIIGLLLATAIPAAAYSKTVMVEEQSIDQLQAMMTAGRASSVDLVRAYRARIAAMDRTGPALRSVIALNPDAEAQARALGAPPDPR